MITDETKSKSYIKKILKNKIYEDALNEMDKNEKMALYVMCQYFMGVSSYNIESYQQAYQKYREFIEKVWRNGDELEKI